ncbi:hypothetical protein L3X38_032393 [Prunus dulcis]|uniref:Reverse transcriptase Ty1/copia-type domain-containing protein n=1 Tax=Prunus dulcis TaxID=3755 RepID=A0AAD4VF42_PRUDU|nr:hypothetical protein L3X38_032393 [Prunus dulcis]
MKDYGFKQSQADHTLFIKHGGDKITMLIMCVDDMVAIGNDAGEIEELQSYWAKEFEMKDFGAIKYFLGIEVSRSKQGIFLSRRKYILDLLVETGKSAISVVSQFMHNLGIHHMEAEDHILQYLKSSHGKGIFFSKNGNLDIEGYTYSDYA